MVHTVHLSLVLVSVIGGRLSVYMVHNHLPSQPLDQGETLDKTLACLMSKTLPNKRAIYVEQLYTTNDPVEQGSMLVVYMALVPESELSSYLRTNMQEIKQLPDSFLEKDILVYAVQRLQWKIEYTNVVYSLLPREFTLGDMQRVYEAILGRDLDKRNFRKKIFSLGILKSTGKKRKKGVSRPDYAKAATGRPAETYAFRTRSLEYVNVL